MNKQLQLVSMGLLVATLSACGGSSSNQSAQLAGPKTPKPDITNPDTTPVVRPETVDANRVRFLVVGDAGSGSDAQMAVGAAMADVCEAKGRATGRSTLTKAEAIRQGCQFVLGLGDNIYEEGTRSANDPQFFTKFERAYLNFPHDLPFFMVSGNHDNSAFFGGDGAGNARGENQVDYTYAAIDASGQEASNPRKTPRWQMPSRYYDFTAGGTVAKPLLHFFAIDSNQVAGGFPDASPEYSYSTYGLRQLNWLKLGMRESKARMKFAFAHHPYLSNGEHGNAGNYDDLLFEQTGQSSASPLAPSLQAALLPVLAGQRYKDFMEEAVCDQADVYFNGHDHDLQWLTSVPSCGKTEFIVSGAGGKTRSASDESRNLARLQRFDQYGFFWVEVSASSDLANPVLRAEMYNVVEGEGDRETAIVKIDGTPDKTVNYRYARVQDEAASDSLTSYLAGHNDSPDSLTRRDAAGLPESAGFSGLPANNCQATVTPSGSVPPAARSTALIAAPGPFDPMQAALSRGLAPWSVGNSPSAQLMAAMTQVTLDSLDIADVVLRASADSARQP
ncbi:MAG: metallophosphoesterase, partial [Paraperlucidibaca sp.]